MILDGQNVLDRNGNSQQAPCGAASFGQFLIRCIRLRQGVIGMVADEGVDFIVQAHDLVEARLHGFAGGDFALSEFRSEFRNGELV